MFVYQLQSFFPLSIFLVLEEGGVKMKLTVIDTPGFGDQINNDNWWVANVPSKDDIKSFNDTGH